MSNDTIKNRNKSLFSKLSHFKVRTSKMTENHFVKNIPSKVKCFFQPLIKRNIKTNLTDIADANIQHLEIIFARKAPTI